MKSRIAFLLFLLPFIGYTQSDSTLTQSMSLSSIYESSVGSVKVSGYAQLDYNQPLDSKYRSNGKIDVHRLVMLFGHRFNERTTFVTEIEFEHVKEVYVEQAFLRYKLRSNMHLKAGLLLIPMGIINEYHEPTTYFSVERPTLSSRVVPTTWRELGVGLTGAIPEATIKYQLYLVNGLASYTDEAKMGGAKGLRSGRQKGAESFISSPNLSAKINYYGLNNINIGLAGYFGKTQSKLYHGIERNDDYAIAQADSSVIDMAMVGLDVRYMRKGLELRAAGIISNHKNTKAYNQFGGTDLGSQMMGGYFEMGYNVLQNAKTKNGLTPFARIEHYDVHAQVEEGTTRNKNYRADELVMGLNFKVAGGAVYKADLQLIKPGNATKANSIVNLGVGIWF